MAWAHEPRASGGAAAAAAADDPHHCPKCRAGSNLGKLISSMRGLLLELSSSLQREWDFIVGRQRVQYAHSRYEMEPRMWQLDMKQGQLISV